MNKIEFVEKARKIHGDKYDYSKSEYKNNKAKVTIVCPIHGEFLQRPNNHLSGQGCPMCGHRSYSYTTEEFVEKARKIHGDKYDYSKTQYKNNNTKVCIICKEHGEFWQTPSNHLNGQGCPMCANKAKKEKRWYSQEEILDKFRSVHGEKYDYSKFEYNGVKKPSVIICQEHGEFLQKPCVHLLGCGCPTCAKSHLEEMVENCLSENGLLFERQKTFPWLKYKSNQFLDFYLPESRIGIECQGEQHFKPLKWFVDKYDVISARDLNKARLCEENDVSLVYFSSKELFMVGDGRLCKSFNDLGLLVDFVKNRVGR